MGADILGGVNPRRDGREDRIPALRKSDRLDWNLMSPSLFLDIINA
jgi:hypothetical protein